MNESYALGIDFGTESGRVMLVRAVDGEEIASAVVPYPSAVISVNSHPACRSITIGPRRIHATT